MWSERQNFLSFWVIFWPFNNPLIIPKTKILKKIKKMCGDIILLYIYVYHKWRSSDDLWFLRYREQQNFLSFWTIFCPFTPLTTWKIKILKKWKKTPGDTTILHIWTINDNHMMYGFWHMESNRQTFLSFWTSFCPFIPLWTHKIKIFKKMKNTWRFYHFTNVYHKWQSYDNEKYHFT